MDKDFINYNNEKIEYVIKKKDIKNINMTVNSDNSIVVSAPFMMAISKIREFILSKIDWIRNTQKYFSETSIKTESMTFDGGETIYLQGAQYLLKIEPSDKNEVSIINKRLVISVKEKYIKDNKYISRIYNTWLKDEANLLYAEIFNKYANILAKHGINDASFEIRKMKLRWGSCIIPKKKILLNLALIKTPLYCIEYVILHELAHLKYKNHNKNYYDFITIFMPDWKERKRELDEEYGGVV
jgi:predicted metal-dependent hydrolase